MSRQKQQLDYTRLMGIHLEEVLGISATTRKEYDAGGCPRNKDKRTYNLPVVFKWYRETKVPAAGPKKPRDASLDNLKKQKLARHIDVMELMLKTKKGEVVPMIQMVQVLASRATTLRRFLTDDMQRNAHLFVGKSLEELRLLFEESVRGAMDAWVNGSVEAEAQFTEGQQIAIKDAMK